MRSTTVTFGYEEAARDFDIVQLPTRLNTKWKEKFKEPLGDILGLVDDLRDKFGAGFELNNVDDLIFLKDVVLNSVVLDYAIGGFDIILDMVISYSPALEADRDWIEENAYDEQVVTALTEELRLALPFQSLAEALSGSGLPSEPTGKNLPEPNGAPPGKKRRPKTSGTSLSPTPAGNVGKQS
jgi:hypothetical protein